MSRNSTIIFLIKEAIWVTQILAKLVNEAFLCKLVSFFTAVLTKSNSVLCHVVVFGGSILAYDKAVQIDHFASL